MSRRLLVSIARDYNHAAMLARSLGDDVAEKVYRFKRDLNMLRARAAHVQGGQP